MSTLIENLTRRINGGIRYDSITTTGTVINTESLITTTDNTIITTGNGTTTAGTIYNPQDWTVTRAPSVTYNPFNFTTSGSYYNLENINIEALRKFIIKEISFVNDLIEIDDSDANTCTMILSVSKEMYGELKVEYIFDKVEDYIKEKISGLINCMDPEFDQGRMNIMFIPNSTLLDIINNDNKE
jgi:hypothetical protein